jgi:hypothetical protein
VLIPLRLARQLNRRIRHEAGREVKNGAVPVRNKAAAIQIYPSTLAERVEMEAQDSFSGIMRAIAQR